MVTKTPKKNDTNEIKTRIGNLPNEELIEYIDNQDDYTVETLKIARDEINRRGGLDNIHNSIIQRGDEQKREETGKKPDIKIGTSGKIRIGLSWGALIVFLAGRELIRAFPNSAVIKIIASAAIGTVIGFLIGLIPYFLADSRGFKKLAKISIITCTLAGLLSSWILAAPTGIVFVIISLSKKVDHVDIRTK